MCVFLKCFEGDGVVFAGIYHAEILVEINPVNLGDFAGAVRLAHGVKAFHLDFPLTIADVLLQQGIHAGVVGCGALECKDNADGRFSLLYALAGEHVDSALRNGVALFFCQVLAAIFIATYVVACNDNNAQQNQINPSQGVAFGAFGIRMPGKFTLAHIR